MPVLIETLWNVKDGRHQLHMERRVVLIETLWNVKSDMFYLLQHLSSFNRNIVECKVDYCDFAGFVKNEF